MSNDTEQSPAKSIFMRHLNDILEFVDSADNAIDNLVENTSGVVDDLEGLVELAEGFDDEDFEDVRANLKDTINRLSGVLDRLDEVSVDKELPSVDENDGE